MSQDRKQPNTNSNAATDKLKPNRTARKSDFRLMYKMTLENKKKITTSSTDFNLCFCCCFIGSVQVSATISIRKYIIYIIINAQY